MQTFDQIFHRYLQNQCTNEELRLLLKQFGSNLNEEQLKALIAEQLSAEVDEATKASLQNSAALKKADQLVLAEVQRKPKIRRLFYSNPFKYAMVIVVLLLAGLAYVYLPKPQQAAVQTSQIIKPGSNKAVLTLANGSVVLLEGNNKQSLMLDEHAKIVKEKDGLLVYTQTRVSQNPQQLEFNQLFIPAGGKYEILLSDGTRVFLNALSSLKYPKTFNTTERVVELSGEAYFEVAKVTAGSKSVPFIVKTSKQNIEVLGTRFTISCYDDDPFQKTTLVSGRVNVVDNQTKQKFPLLPGQQALYRAEGHTTISNANTEAALAWAQGNFMFDDVYLKDILKQLSRWYNVNVDYKNIKETRYNILLSRSETLNNVLKALEDTGNIKFTITNNTIKILN